MKKLKKIRNITLVLLILVIIFVIYIAGNEFLKGNYYSDYLGNTVFFWYERFYIKIAIYLYYYIIPLLIDIGLLVVSSIKIKKLK